MTSAQGLLATGLLPPPMIIQLSLEMIKMMLHPVRHSRGVIDLINGYQEVLTKFMGALTLANRSMQGRLYATGT